jgi:hypothetical protein
MTAKSKLAASAMASRAMFSRAIVTTWFAQGRPSRAGPLLVGVHEQHTAPTGEAAATLMDRVDFPTPPFWFKNEATGTSPPMRIPTHVRPHQCGPVQVKSG